MKIMLINKFSFLQKEYPVIRNREGNIKEIGNEDHYIPNHDVRLLVLL